MTELITRWEVPGPGLQRLTCVQVPRPQPKAGEVLVQVEAVALNYRDGEVLENGMGVALPYPFVPTSDMAGTVVEVGDGDSRFSVGDRVISQFICGWIDGAPLSWTQAPTQGGPVQGMLAEYVATNAEWCVHAPRSLSAAEACTLPVAALTAWMALVELGHVHAGQTVVVQGTGGVSLFAVQLAAANGATVIVTSGSDDKLERAKALGARHGINRHRQPDWHTAVLALTEGRGAEHILEMVGGDNLHCSLQALTNGGRIAVIGLLESDQMSLPIMALLGSRASISGISVGPRRALEDLVRMIDRHAIKPVIDQVYSFAEVPQAFAHLQRGAFGKVVIQVSGS